MLCYLNGVLLPQSEARVPIADRGFLYGDSLFETTRVHGGRALFLQRHLDRLELGMQVLGFDERPARADLSAACEQVLHGNDLQTGVLRLAVTRGITARGANPVGAHSPTVLVTAAPLPPDLEQRVARGYRIITSQWRKPAPDVLPSQVKTGNYLNSVLAMQQAAQVQADEALLLDHEGCIVECSHSSLFFVQQGSVLTPDLGSGALHGITRDIVIALAREIGLEVTQQRIAASLVTQVHEAFITNAVIGIAPVARLDAMTYPVPGRVTSLLQAAWLLLISQKPA